MEETRYLYQITPKKPITGLSGVKCLTVPKSLSLTKEEVKLCFGKSSIYRRFANEMKIVRVVPSNLDRLHNAKFMSEEEYSKFKSSEIGNTGITEVPTNSVVNEPEVSIPKDESTTVEPDVQENIEEEVKPDTVDESANVVEKSNNQNQNPYKGKNKRR